MISKLAYWKIRERHWREEPSTWSPRYYGLQQKGYQGYCVDSYSPYERELLKKFSKDTESFLTRHYKCEAHDSRIGNYEEPGFSIFTKEIDAFEALMESIPKRTHLVIFPREVKKLKFKTEFNHLYIEGRESIALSYHYDETIPEDSDIITKITLMKLCA